MNRYLECFFGNLPGYLRSWADENKNALTRAQGTIEHYMSQHMLAGDTAADRQKIIRITVHAHRRLAAWHQHTADMINALGAANFLVRTEVEAILSEVQNSYANCSSTAKKFINELKTEKITPLKS